MKGDVGNLQNEDKEDIIKAEGIWYCVDIDASEALYEATSWGVEKCSLQLE